MKISKEILGVILAFSVSGIIATGADSHAYETVYQEQATQTQRMNQMLDSEFISTQDETLIQKELDTSKQAKKKDNRKSIRKQIEKTDQQVTKVQSRLDSREGDVANQEYTDLSYQVSTLSKKSQEQFVTVDDKKEINDLSSKVEALKSGKKVAPIRELSKETMELDTQLVTNQTELKQIVSHIKKANKESVELEKKPYLVVSLKDKLKEDQKQNELFIKQANDIDKTKERHVESLDLLTSVKDIQERSTQEFKSYESKAKDLDTKVKTLLSEGILDNDEKSSLEKEQTELNNYLDLKDYEPGKLKETFEALDVTYSSSLDNSNERKFEQEKEDREKREQEAKEQEAREKKAREEAAQQSREQSQQSSPKEATVTSDGWHQAPNGYKYLKVESGKTYGQVKNPDNFKLITAGEASSYSPGHGNGSAKQ